MGRLVRRCLQQGLARSPSPSRRLGEVTCSRTAVIFSSRGGHGWGVTIGGLVATRRGRSPSRRRRTVRGGGTRGAGNAVQGGAAPGYITSLQSVIEEGVHLVVHHHGFPCRHTDFGACCWRVDFQVLAAQRGYPDPRLAAPAQRRDGVWRLGVPASAGTARRRRWIWGCSRSRRGPRGRRVPQGTRRSRSRWDANLGGAKLTCADSMIFLPKRLRA